MSQLSLLFKDRILSIHPLNQRSDFIIGNAPECNIHIDSLAVSPRHAKIFFAGNAYVLEELENESNILVNNKKVDSSAQLSDGDYINVGKHTLIFAFDERNENRQIREPELIPVKENGTGWVQYLNGRKMGNTTQIKQSMANITDDAEENIALISNRTDGFYLSYLKGDESPIVNNTNIGEKSTRLENNSYISLGSLKLLFYIN
ncbi:MAG: FHA domain-containing protein [Gammaproteobacteria bacterium]|nr:FHA domain-containing protein [Gammaproteobacteria bacterium]